MTSHSERAMAGSEAELARRLFRYDIATGELFWAVRASMRTRAGDRAGSVSSGGYRQVRFNGRHVQEHRVVWLIVRGQWPHGEIDHLDGDRTNNRFANLRDVGRDVNMQNRRQAARGAATGLLGASRHKRGFQASIRHGGRQVYLGVFPTAEEAHAAYVSAKRRLHQGNTL